MACFDFYFAMVVIDLSKAAPSMGAKYKVSYCQLQIVKSISFLSLLFFELNFSICSGGISSRFRSSVFRCWPLNGMFPKFCRGKSGAVVVRAGESRFGLPTPFKGVNPNDLKLSSKDTNGQLSTFWYKGMEKTGPSFHAHPIRMKCFM